MKHRFILFIIVVIILLYDYIYVSPLKMLLDTGILIVGMLIGYYEKEMIDITVGAIESMMIKNK